MHSGSFKTSLLFSVVPRGLVYAQPCQLFKTYNLEDSSSGSNWKSWDTRYAVQTLYSSGILWELAILPDYMARMGDGEYDERVLSAFSTSFHLGNFTLTQDAGAAQPVSRFLIKGINLYVAVELVYLWWGRVQSLLFCHFVVTLRVSFKTKHAALFVVPQTCKKPDILQWVNDYTNTVTTIQ